MVARVAGRMSTALVECREGTAMRRPLGRCADASGLPAAAAVLNFSQPPAEARDNLRMFGVEIGGFTDIARQVIKLSGIFTGFTALSNASAPRTGNQFPRSLANGKSAAIAIRDESCS